MANIEDNNGKSKTRSTTCLVILLLFIMCSVIPLLAVATPLSPDSSQVKNALNYLKACQQDDGGFGSGGLTEWVVIAIAATGQDAGRWYHNGRTPLEYLHKQKLTDNPYDWIRIVLALSSLGIDPCDFKGNNYVEKIKAFYQGTQFGDPLSLRDDYWAVLAMVSAGEGSARQVQNSAQFILSHQNPDGSWSASTTGVETCADNTAIAMVALRAAGIERKTSQMQKGLEYLKRAQNADGGFSYLFMPSNTASDAWVLQALWAIEGDPSFMKDLAGKTMTHLLSLQQDNGSFQWTNASANSPLLMTAYALPALLGKSHPIHYRQSDTVTVGLRVEGGRQTLLNTQLTLGPGKIKDAAGVMHSTVFPSPLAVISTLSAKKLIEAVIEDTSLGLYLKGINKEVGSWQYRVNDRLPMAGANEYHLESGDEVVWFYDYNGCKSLLCVEPEIRTVWEGERVRFAVKLFSDADDRWKPVTEARLVSGSEIYPVKDGTASILFERSGNYVIYADKEDAVRSEKITMIVEKRRPVKVTLRIKDNGKLICADEVSFFDLKVQDINGIQVDIRRPVLLGALEAARQKDLLNYRIIQTSEGLILVDINDLAENNRFGSWWYEVNGQKVLEDIDEYEVHDGDNIMLYRSLHPRQTNDQS